MPPLRLGLFASHTGTNLQVVLDACANETLRADSVVVIGNNSNAVAFERARRFSVPTVHLSSKTHPSADDLDEAIVGALKKHDVNLVVLVGYNKQLGPRTVSAYRNRILNIHPAPLPEFGGPGLYGLRVHEAVLQAGCTETAVTVHLVDEEYDHGPTVSVSRVPVLSDDTPETLQQRVIEAGHVLLLQTLQEIALGNLDLDRSSLGAGAAPTS